MASKKLPINVTHTARVGDAVWSITRIPPFGMERDELDWFRCVRDGVRSILLRQSKLSRPVTTPETVAANASGCWKYGEWRNGKG